MNIQSNGMPDSPRDSQINDAQEIASMSATRPLYWSVQRELWENHSIYIAPLAAAAVYMLGFSISLFWMPRSMRAMGASHSTPLIVELAMPYAHTGMLLALTAFLVGIFYSLDALHGERRDRSILFWKSLPVSDSSTVLAKASVPLVILPVLVFVITVFLQIVMRLESGAFLLLSGASTAMPSVSQLFEMQLVLLYEVIVLTLWHAPLYMWMLLVSGWPRRATFLWAVLPPLALAAIEYIAFHTSHLAALLHGRLLGFDEIAFDLKDKNGIPIDPHFIPLAQLAPGRFLSSPSLWLGLIFAAISVAAAVRLRRYQGPQ
jgi:ABC-2 type transport system permease protein